MLPTTLLSTLAWRPFLDPLDLHRWWFVLIVPLSLGISVAYKAIRVERMRGYWREVAMMTAHIVLGMAALGAASYLFVQHLLPAIAPK